jgi:hypothetical protein
MPATQPTRAPLPRPAASCLLPPVSPYLDAHSAVSGSISAESPSNSADFVSNTAVSHLTSPQSSSPITTVNAANMAACVTNAAESHLTGSQPHPCCRARQHHPTPAESITIPQRGRGGRGA